MWQLKELWHNHVFYLKWVYFPGSKTLPEVLFYIYWKYGMKDMAYDSVRVMFLMEVPLAPNIKPSGIREQRVPTSVTLLLQSHRPYFRTTNPFIPRLITGDFPSTVQ